MYDIKLYPHFFLRQRLVIISFIHTLKYQARKYVDVFFAIFFFLLFQNKQQKTDAKEQMREIIR